MYSTNAVAMKRLTVELASASRAAISSLENCGGATGGILLSLYLFLVWGEGVWLCLLFFMC